MTKNDIINDVVCSLTLSLNQDQLDLVKSVFIVKMQGYEIHELCTLPSTEVRDNEWLYKRFAIDMVAKNLKTSTIKAYMDHIRPFFEYTNLNYMAVTSQNIIDYIAIRKVTPNKYGKINSAAHISNISKALFVFFQWAYRKHHIENDIMRDVDRIKQPVKKKERISLEEIASCRHAISCIDKVDDENISIKKVINLRENKKRKEALFELMLSTGLRVGEVANLKIEDIDFDKRKVHVSEGKTEYAIRDVYLSFTARDAILRLIDNRRSGYVFRSVKDSIPEDKKIGTGTIEKWAKEIGQAGNCHCETTVHVYRKTFASETYRRTNNVKLVSILLGHSSTAVTEKHYLVDDMQEIEHQALQVA